MAWQRLKVEVPKEYSPTEREDFGVLVADYIRERTAKGVGVRDGATYKFAGKSKGKVDLVLSGDMLAELDVLRTKPGEVVVGFENGTEANDKAEGNILGSYGGDPNPKRARNFLGLTSREVEALVRKFERERG
jgi:hypothetical protein